MSLTHQSTKQVGRKGKLAISSITWISKGTIITENKDQPFQIQDLKMPAIPNNQTMDALQVHIS